MQHTSLYIFSKHQKSCRSIPPLPINNFLFSLKSHEKLERLGRSGQSPSKTEVYMRISISQVINEKSLMAITYPFVIRFKRFPVRFFWYAVMHWTWLLLLFVQKTFSVYTIQLMLWIKLIKPQIFFGFDRGNGLEWSLPSFVLVFMYATEWFERFWVLLLQEIMSHTLIL